MENYTKTIAGQEVGLSLDPAFQQIGQDILSWLEDMLQEGEDWSKEVLPLHYSKVRLVPQGQGWQVETLALQGEEPLSWTEDLSYFAQIIDWTNQAAKKTKTRGKMIPFTYESPVIVANHTFESQEWYAHRFDDETWYLAPIDQSVDTQPLQGFQAYQVFAQFPDLYQVMHLPTDYIALFYQDTLQSVLDPESNEVWT